MNYHLLIYNCEKKSGKKKPKKKTEKKTGKMERLNFENLVFVRIKKNFLNFLLYLGQECF